MPSYKYMCPQCGRKIVMLRKSDKRDDLPICKHYVEMIRIIDPNPIIHESDGLYTPKQKEDKE